jgi:hypothetical protein
MGFGYFKLLVWPKAVTKATGIDEFVDAIFGTNPIGT